MGRGLFSAAFLALALGSTSIATASAAGRAEQYSGDWTSPTTEETGLCPFRVSVTSHIVFNGVNRYDAAGNYVQTEESDVERDTFSTPGHTLVSDPYRYNTHFRLDADGNITVLTATGHVLKVTLPSGTVFMSAGRIDWLTHSGGFAITPDVGRSGSLDAFCAALS